MCSTTEVRGQYGVPMGGWVHVGWIGVDMSRMLPYMIVWNPTGLHFDRDRQVHQP